MRKNLFIAVILIFLLKMTVIAAFADSGWKGYDLYNISSSSIEVVKEKADIVLKDKKVYFTSEYVLKNNSNNEVKAVLGMPSDFIGNIRVWDRGILVKNYAATLKTVSKINGKTNMLPSEDKWRLFNVTVKPGDFNVVTISYEADVNVSEDGTIILSYPYEYQNSSEMFVKDVSLTLHVDNFEPYNLISIEGTNADSYRKYGRFSWDSSENDKGFVLKYLDAEQAAFDFLQRENQSKYKNIINRYKAKDYSEVIRLSQQLIDSETKPQVMSILKYILAESNRKLYKNEEYVQASEKGSLSKLYPEQLNLKVYYDRANTYKLLGNNEGVKKELVNIGEAAGKDAIIYQWASFDYSDLSQVKQEGKMPGNKKGEAKENNFMSRIYEYKAASTIYLGLALLTCFVIGLLVGKISKRRRRDRYMFKR